VIGRSFVIRAGARAAAQVHERGLAASDIACVPAAAGGPKGLALVPLDRLLFGEWFDRTQADRRQAPLQLIGASIGAWRLFAAAQADPVKALNRLADSYVAQTYPHRPSAACVSAECRKLAQAVLGRSGATRDCTPLDGPRPGFAVSIITARARGALHADRSRRAFVRAALANAVSRSRLAAHLQRVLFTQGAATFPAREFDAFGLARVALSADNAEDALLASGSIPLVCDPVTDPAGAPSGQYWDGGLIDYHLLLPYRDLAGVVLYPHFVPLVIPGWLDKFLPWRTRPRSQGWLDNVLLIAPSRELLARLPNGKLPDRNDFYRYGLDHDRRQRDWRRAIAECERMADDVMQWLARPDPTLIEPL
jgi:hypothetical protein